MADDEPREQIQLSFAQIAASSLAAVSAAIVCSLFGVAGTVIGTAVASVLATVGSAIYVYSMRRTKARLLRLHQAGAAAPPFVEVVKTAREQGRKMLGQLPLRLIAIGAAVVFVVSIGVVTAVEAGVGKSFAALFGVSHSGGHGTSVASVFNPHHKHKPTPSPTKSSTKPTPTPRPTATKTVTATPTATTSPTATTTPTNVISTLLPGKSPKHQAKKH